MVTKIKALRMCAVVAGRNVHQLKAGEEKSIEITDIEIKYATDRGDIVVVGAKPVAPKPAPVAKPAPVVPKVAPKPVPAVAKPAPKVTAKVTPKVAPKPVPPKPKV